MLTQLRERLGPPTREGVQLVGVATRDDYQAQRLIDEGIGVSLLLDPADSIRTAIGAADRFGWGRLLHPRGAVDYVRALRQARRFDPIWAEANQRPALLLLDPELEILWSHIGARIGDYPDVDDVMAQVRELG